MRDKPLKASLSGYSDDCAHVHVEGQRRFNFSEYTDKRLILTLPSGEQVIAELRYNDGWGVYFDIPDSVSVEAQERDIHGDNPDEWTRLGGSCPPLRR